MKTNLFYVNSIRLLAIGISFVLTTTLAQADTHQKIEKIETYMEISGLNDSTEELVESMIPSQEDFIDESNDSEDPESVEFYNHVLSFVHERLKPELAKQIIINNMLDSTSEQHIDVAIQFYGSPTGQKILKISDATNEKIQDNNPELLADLKSIPTSNKDQRRWDLSQSIVNRFNFAESFTTTTIDAEIASFNGMAELINPEFAESNGTYQEIDNEIQEMESRRQPLYKRYKALANLFQYYMLSQLTENEIAEFERFVHSDAAEEISETTFISIKQFTINTFFDFGMHMAEQMNKTEFAEMAE